MTLDDLEPCLFVSTNDLVYAFRSEGAGSSGWWIPCRVVIASGNHARVFSEKFKVDRWAHIDSLQKLKKAIASERG